jgi:hypothetical protein
MDPNEQTESVLSDKLLERLLTEHLEIIDGFQKSVESDPYKTPGFRNTEESLDKAGRDKVEVKDYSQRERVDILIRVRENLDYLLKGLFSGLAPGQQGRRLSSPNRQIIKLVEIGFLGEAFADVLRTFYRVFPLILQSEKISDEQFRYANEVGSELIRVLDRIDFE